MTLTQQRLSAHDNVYRIVAANPLRDDALVVEDSRGRMRLFLRSTGAVTHKPVNPSFLALLRQNGWRTAADSGWHTHEELTQPVR